MAEAPSAKATVLATRHRTLQQARPAQRVKSSALTTLGLFLLTSLRPTLDSWTLDTVFDLVVKGYFLLCLVNTFLFLWKTRQLAACKRELRQFPLQQLALLGIHKEDLYPPGVEPPKQPPPQASSPLAAPRALATTAASPFESSRNASLRLRSPPSATHHSIFDAVPTAQGGPSRGAPNFGGGGFGGAGVFGGLPAESATPPRDASGLYGFASSPTAAAPNAQRYHPSPPQNPRPANDRRIVPAHAVWTRIMQVAERDVHIATMKCQKWFVNTVLGPLVDEIDSINLQLVRRQLLVRIGESSLDDLDRLQQTLGAGDLASRVNRLRPFLSIHTNQSLLLLRLRDLAKVSATVEILNSSFPSDTQILIHVFCRFCDMQLYLASSQSEGRFTALHYLGQTDVPTITNKRSMNLSDFNIFLTNSLPVTAKVLLLRKSDEFILDLPPGRENAYEVILLAMCYARDHGRFDGDDLKGLAGLGAEDLPPRRVSSLSDTAETFVSDLRRLL